MKKVFIILFGLGASFFSAAQKVIPLVPNPIVYYPKSITVHPTGSINNANGTFVIYYELRDTNNLLFESGNKEIPVVYFPLFLDNADPTGLSLLLQAEGLEMKLEEPIE